MNGQRVYLGMLTAILLIFATVTVNQVNATSQQATRTETFVNTVAVETNRRLARIETILDQYVVRGIGSPSGGR